jgi:addiction module RelE/StbE family toxin
MTVVWTETAQEHLDEIYRYIARESQFYAKRVVDRLTRRSIQIADFPFSGREVPEYRLKQIREVIEGSYRIIYYIKSDGIDVLAVLHCAQNCLKETDQETGSS